MANKTVGEIDIAAPLSEVLAVIADVDSYSQWVKGMSASATLDKDTHGRPAQGQFSVSASGVEDTYVLAYDWSKTHHEISDGTAAGADPQAVSWSLVRAKKITQLDGCYELTSTSPGETHVTYSLSFSVKIPMFSMMKAKAERALTSAALNDLKNEAERRHSA